MLSNTFLVLLYILIVVTSWYIIYKLARWFFIFLIKFVVTAQREALDDLDSENDSK